MSDEDGMCGSRNETRDGGSVTGSDVNGPGCDERNWRRTETSS